MSMGWLAPACAAPALWAASNVLDSRLASSWLPTALTATCVVAAFNAMVLAGTWSALGDVSISGTALAAASTAAGLLAYFLYFVALRRAATADVVMMWHLAPAMTATLAFLTLGERLEPIHVAGVAVLAASGLVASADRSRRRTGRWSAGYVMAGACFAVAVENVATKGATNVMSVSATLAVQGVCSVVAAACFFARRSVRQQLRAVVRSIHGAGLVSVTQALDAGAQVLSVVALGAGPAGLVSAVGGLQPVIVLLLEAASRRFRGVRSAIRPRDVRRTSFAIALAALGLAAVASHG